MLARAAKAWFIVLFRGIGVDLQIQQRSLSHFTPHINESWLPYRDSSPVNCHASHGAMLHDSHCIFALRAGIRRPVCHGWPRDKVDPVGSSPKSRLYMKRCGSVGQTMSNVCLSGELETLDKKNGFIRSVSLNQTATQNIFRRHFCTEEARDFHWENQRCLLRFKALMLKGKLLCSLLANWKQFLSNAPLLLNPPWQPAMYITLSEIQPQRIFPPKSHGKMIPPRDHIWPGWLI